MVAVGEVAAGASKRFLGKSTFGTLFTACGPGGNKAKMQAFSQCGAGCTSLSVAPSIPLRILAARSKWRREAICQVMRIELPPGCSPGGHCYDYDTIELVLLR